MERNVVDSQVPATGKMGDSHLKAHLLLSVEAEAFVRRGGGGQNEEIKEECCQFLYMQMSTVRSRKASDGPVCVILV